MSAERCRICHEIILSGEHHPCYAGHDTTQELFCRECNQWLPIASFYVLRKTDDRVSRRLYCRECERAARAERNLRDRLRRIEKRVLECQEQEAHDWHHRKPIMFERGELWRPDYSSRRVAVSAPGRSWEDW